MNDYGEKDGNQPNFKALKPKSQSTAVAIKDGGNDSAPVIKAAARGALADKILEIAFENDIKVREDADLADLLATFELDSPIPTEALMAVAEILSYVYRANGQPDPFNAIIDDIETNDQ
jgi:flagellar biosynthesis protein